MDFSAIRVPNSGLRPKILGRERFLVASAFNISETILQRRVIDRSRDGWLERRTVPVRKGPPREKRRRSYIPCLHKREGGWCFIFFDTPLREARFGIPLSRRRSVGGPRKSYGARYRSVLSFEQVDFASDVLLPGVR